MVEFFNYVFLLVISVQALMVSWTIMQGLLVYIK